MGQSHSEEKVNTALTVGGLVGLNLPCLASRMPSNTLLGALKGLGPPFNMANETLDRHFSYSTKNMIEGRYYTSITCLFNHAGLDHFKSNMSVLIVSGFDVHMQYGRKHLLTAFIGGGIAGCAAQFSLYLHQQIKWENILPSPRIWSILGESVTTRLDYWQKVALGNVFSHVNSWKPCVGCSAALSALMAVQCCSNIVSLAGKVKHVGSNMDVRTMCQVSQLILTTLVLYEDLSVLIGSTLKGTGLLGNLVAYSVDGVGHAAHVGGFMFGLLYYSLFLYKKQPCQP